jgi:hypothetical protein
MKKGKRVKPKFPIEYRLLMVRRMSERDKTMETFVALRTTLEFRNFLYEIIVEPIAAEQTLHLKIHGLRAPQVTIPGTGPAKFSATFGDLHGRYEVIITKPNGEENAFTVHIANDHVEVEKGPRKKFADLVTREEEW